MPQAIVAFLENGSFEDVIKGAISIGGDSGIKFAVRTMSEMVRQIRPELWSPWNDPAPNVQPNGEDL